MKQHITPEQLNELSEKAHAKLKHWTKAKWCVNKNYGWKIPLPSIGQMIEFLDENQEYQFHIFRRTFDWKVIVNDLHYGKEVPGELCDFLWEAVKEVLENDK